jgi:hypothetical protein
MPVHPRPQVNVVNTVGGNKKRRNLEIIGSPRAANPKKVEEQRQEYQSGSRWLRVLEHLSEILE